MPVKFCKRKPLFFLCAGIPYYYVWKEQRYYGHRGDHWVRFNFAEDPGNVEESIKSGLYVPSLRKEKYTPFTTENIRQ